MPNPIFLDTLFVVALVNRRDQYHQRATELAEQFAGDDFVVTDAVLLEIGNALARNYKVEAVAVLEEFLSSEEVQIVHLTPQLFESGFALFRQYQDKSWGFVDCISFVVMHQMDITAALTFDQHFIQAGFQALMRP